MSLYDRIGIDIGRKLSLEDAVAWASALLAMTAPLLSLRAQRSNLAPSVLHCTRLLPRCAPRNDSPGD